jgi:2-polyprenyl-6-hydroxyphenyl methylase/3-demethylubiquinone-9 3-methyltransferase
MSGMPVRDEKTDVSTHYRFGDNWSRFARGLTEEQRASARSELARFVGVERLSGATFLDLGSGSGVHSLAALELGVSSLSAVDFDPESVRTTEEVLRAHAPCNRWSVWRANILTDFAASAERYDIVYSWGVLHHTGSMWQALEQALCLVRPGGYFAVALYNKTPMCPAWTVEKRVFSRLPRFVQSGLTVLFVGLLVLRQLLTFTNPVKWYRGYADSRGMSPYFDAHDWLGGYPYESVDHESLVIWMKTRGVTLEYSYRTKGSIGVFGTPCGEYLFRVGHACQT